MAESAKRTLGDIEKVVIGLAHGQEALRQAFNQNHLAYSRALGAVDGHIAVLRAVINDLQRGDVQIDAEGNIDWNVYYTWYNDMVAKEQEQNAAAPQVAEEEVFGGDYEGDDHGSRVRQVPEGEPESTGEAAS